MATGVRVDGAEEVPVRGAGGREDRAHPLGGLGGRQLPWPTPLGDDGVHENRDREPGHGRD
ncbi:hypothetical protein [Rhodococcus sp. ACPA1]|uniref:hypothetical protein n=1 Tax=Rhodococcus sp. ACPA1 TaxID=2028572 RepID=UPI0015CCB511